MMHHQRSDPALGGGLPVPLPAWIGKYQSFEGDAFAASLDRAARLEPALAVLERSHQWLDRFEAVRQTLLSSAGDRQVTADRLYDKIVSHYAAMASYGAIYSRLCRNGYLEPGRVKALADAGPGYWNSALIYNSLFPHLIEAHGFEIDSEKIQSYRRETRQLLALPDKFQMHEADMFGIFSRRDHLVALTRRADFDLIVMQSYFPLGPRDGSMYLSGAPDPKDRADYEALFDGMQQALTEHGRLVVMLDLKDFEYSESIVQAADLLTARGARVVNDSRIAHHPHWGVDIPIHVRCYILGPAAR